MNAVAALERARALQAAGRTMDAERAYRELAGSGTQREAALGALADLYVQSGRATEAVDTLIALTEEPPARLYHYARLAGLLEALGRLDEAIDHYVRLIERQPELANAHFNVALLYRKAKRYEEAVASYEQAVRLGVEGLPEVYSNMGVLYSEMRRADDARRMYEKALELEPGYIPALFNLAGLLEETGDRPRATELYKRILSIDPNHRESLSRLAHARRQTPADADLLESLQRASQEASGDPVGREAVYFALGKMLDDLGRYDEAFAAYRSANELGRLRNPPYQAHAVERFVDRQIELFSADWLARAVSTLAARPIFICGMFRSGSTLIEQILGSHPDVTAGDELDFFPWVVQQNLMPYPDRAAAATPAELEAAGNRYLALVRSIFPEGGRITDKRPDNFLHLGLIGAVFPGARIIHTKRNALDNCLSVYFQQLGGNLHYATDLRNIAHYYGQHSRLMEHWAGILGSRLCTVDYDELVREPEPVIRALLGFLDLEWNDRCLSFGQGGGAVKTASVWQVREALHTRSSGRWQLYERHLREAQTILEGSAGRATAPTA